MLSSNIGSFFVCLFAVCLFVCFFNLQSAVSEFLDFRVLFWEKSMVLLCSPEMFVFVSEGVKLRVKMW